ncbi:retropepsin-like aspartic protease family protein [Parvibaculum sp.]|uniref:retropepsin-like aspartic protease family protein n=1 Tax=Parvibaculum sp. TaxID=2024848 RepID=UPI002BECC437|nr:TIGR02281 family clan AA aspartic protease [Parvibaculum sp.]HUD52091.1 TIGR02281 family clan AA aspartic protease [Parvibaculum sp.]
MRDNRWTWAALLLLAVVALLYFLNSRFPGALAEEDGRMRLVYGLVWLVLIGSSVAVGWRGRAGLALKQALAWVAIAMILVVAYSYRGDFMGLGGQLAERAMGELAPSAAVQTAPGVVYLTRDLSGHYSANALVNGTHVRFMVDTGASDVALTAEDAERLGFDLDKLAYTVPYGTANGTVMAARVTLDEIAIGDIKVRNVRASVSRSGLGQSLLGMSFLNELRGFEFQGNRLVLRE